MKTMTASRLAKAAGLKSLKYVSEQTGVSVQTLNNWHKNKPALFTIVLIGSYFAEKPLVKD
jgi:hypothetical protein